MDSSKDKWAIWLAERRFGNDLELQKKSYRALNLLRDKIISNASIQPGDTVLDIGTGDGLLGFGVLNAIPDVGKVIFSDISDDNLDFCRAAAADLNIRNSVEFVNTPAEQLLFPDSSIDVVLARAVYIYIKDKDKAFKEAHRVLKPNGRFSIGEPINRFKVLNKQRYDFMGIDLTPIQDIADKFFVAFKYPHEIDESPMTDFDERTLFDIAHDCGFYQILMQYEAKYSTKVKAPTWEVFYNIASNPNAPTLKEAFKQTLNEKEERIAIDYINSVLEKGFVGTKTAYANLTAVKDEP
jgi:ubiquinone/menaquinone biosynthesis C-methylase UbiE